jgi:hypothetical protein
MVESQDKTGGSFVQGGITGRGVVLHRLTGTTLRPASESTLLVTLRAMQRRHSTAHEAVAHAGH